MSGSLSLDLLVNAFSRESLGPEARVDKAALAARIFGKSKLIDAFVRDQRPASQRPEVETFFTDTYGEHRLIITGERRLPVNRLLGSAVQLLHGDMLERTLHLPTDLELTALFLVPPAEWQNFGVSSSISNPRTDTRDVCRPFTDGNLCGNADPENYYDMLVYMGHLIGDNFLGFDRASLTPQS